MEHDFTESFFSLLQGEKQFQFLKKKYVKEKEEESVYFFLNQRKMCQLAVGKKISFIVWNSSIKTIVSWIMDKYKNCHHYTANL